jgi:hypothetical protein
MTQHEVFWSETLPWKTKQVEAVLVEAAKEITDVSARAIDAILGHIRNEQVLAGTEYERFEALDFPDEDHVAVQIYAHVYDALRMKVREGLQVLEELAVSACLDGVDWTLPADDMEAVLLLLTRADGRSAQPKTGGIDLSVWKVQEPRVSEGVKMWGAEGYDMLDVAEEEHLYYTR